MTSSPPENNVELSSAVRPLEFMDLGTDCLRELCDRLDIELLINLAGTCRHMEAIARASFAARKITEVQYYWHINRIADDSLHIESEEIFLRALKHFGDFFTRAIIRHGYVHIDVNDEEAVQKNAERVRRIEENACDWLACYCSGTMTALGLDDFTNYGSAFEKNPLFTRLPYLMLQGFSDTNFPLVEFEQLTTLRVQMCSPGMVSACLGATFPTLKHLEIVNDYVPIDQREFDDFIGRHPQLTEVEITCSPGLLTISLLRLQNLEKLVCDDGMSMVALAGHRKLKSLTYHNSHMKALILILYYTPALRNTLEELNCDDIGVDVIDIDSWTRLSQMTKLRKLSLVFADIPHLDVVEGIKKLAEQSSSIEFIGIQCNLNSEFQRSNNEHVDQLCGEKGIMLVIRGRYTLRDDENRDEVAREFDKLSRKNNATVVMGKRG